MTELYAFDLSPGVRARMVRRDRSFGPRGVVIAITQVGMSWFVTLRHSNRDVMYRDVMYVSD